MFWKDFHMGPSPRKGLMYIHIKVVASTAGVSLKRGNGERCLWLCSLDVSSLKSFQHWMVHRAAPISVSITLGHTSAKCSESYSRGFNSQLVAPCIQLPFYILWMSSVRQEGRRYRTIFTVFSMTRPEFEPAATQSWGGRSNHKAIKLVTFPWCDLPLPMTDSMARHNHMASSFFFSWSDSGPGGAINKMKSGPKHYDYITVKFFYYRKWYKINDWSTGKSLWLTWMRPYWGQ